MFPHFDFGTIPLPWGGEFEFQLPLYGLMFALSAVLAWIWFMARGRKLGIAEEHLFNLCFYALLGGIVGAKALLIILDWRAYFSGSPGDIFWNLFGTLRSAGVLIGGIILGSLAFIAYSRKHKLPLFVLADAMAAPLVMAQAIGRLGCFFAGCCHGKPVAADHPLAVVFTHPAVQQYSGVPLNTPVAATQLMQFANDMLLAGVLTLLWRRGLKPAGSVFWWYLILYGIGRSIVEIWRGDTERGLFFGDLLSTSQILGLSGVAIGLFMLIRGRTQQAREATG